MDDSSDTPLLDLECEMSRAVRDGRGITLTAAQLDIFVTLGGLRIISDAAQACLLDLAKSRTSLAPPARRAQKLNVPVESAVPKRAVGGAAPGSGAGSIRPELNEAEHRAAERKALEAAARIRRQRRRVDPAA